jgi:hypothetical protein
MEMFLPSQSSPHIVNLTSPRISILPEGEKFLLVIALIYGFSDAMSFPHRNEVFELLEPVLDEDHFR